MNESLTSLLSLILQPVCVLKIADLPVNVESSGRYIILGSGKAGYTLLNHTLPNRNLLYRNLLNHTLPNRTLLNRTLLNQLQESAKPHSAKPESAKT